jgi:hypothetical protein
MVVHGYNDTAVEAGDALKPRRSLKKKPRQVNLQSSLSCAFPQNTCPTTYTAHSSSGSDVSTMNHVSNSEKRKRCDSGVAEDLSKEAMNVTFDCDGVIRPLVWEWRCKKSNHRSDNRDQRPSTKNCNETRVPQQPHSPSTSNTIPESMKNDTSSPNNHAAASIGTSPNSPCSRVDTPCSTVMLPVRNAWSTSPNIPDEFLVDFDGLADICKLSCQTTSYSPRTGGISLKLETPKSPNKFGDIIDPFLHFGNSVMVPLSMLEYSERFRPERVWASQSPAPSGIVLIFGGHCSRLDLT